MKVDPIIEQILWYGILQAGLPIDLSYFDEKTPLNRTNKILGPTHVECLSKGNGLELRRCALIY